MRPAAAPRAVAAKAGCAACSVHQDLEDVLLEAGRRLGRRGKASSEDVRAGLRAGHDELAKARAVCRADRRTMAHPLDALPVRALEALVTGPPARVAGQQAEQTHGSTVALGAWGFFVGGPGFAEDRRAGDSPSARAKRR